MAKVHHVAVAGAGRIGSPVVHELLRAGFRTTVLTRNATHVKGFHSSVTIREVDYDSDDSLRAALQGQDAVVSTVAMSGIENQKRMIDAAIAVGVKYFIPAEFTLASRDPQAQWLPMYATILDIQTYLSAREHQINWMVIGCGGLLEFVLDYPFILDFDTSTATLWDGGDGATSISTFDTVAKAVVGVLKQPERVQNHGVRIDGGVLSQNKALQIAKKYSTDTWTVHEREAEPVIQDWLDKLKSGALGSEELLTAMMTIIAAATFGKGHFDAAYHHNDNDWLGIDAFDEGVIEDAIRKRITHGTWAAQSGTDAQESMGDVADGLATKFGDNSRNQEK